MRQALEMALEAVKTAQNNLAPSRASAARHDEDALWDEYDATITAIKEALAQPEQEPVAWINWCAATGKRSVSFECESELASQPLYTKEQS